jgi:sulfite reductase (NADPH) hemoprotein beta-component
MKAITANRLIDGEVIFWNEGQWVERFADAQVFGPEDDAHAEAALDVAKGQPTVIVEPYFIDEEEAPTGGLAPDSYSERLRALGPTNLPHHGKQAEGGAAIEALLAATGHSRSTGRVNLIRRK